MAHDNGLDDETNAGGTPDDYEGPPCCPICGQYTKYVECVDCDGDGGFHDCGEDTCCCLDKEEITVDCETCHGQGGYRECSALPHTDEQLNRFRALKAQGVISPSSDPSGAPG